jgi:2'-5' RNA ligase
VTIPGSSAPRLFVALRPTAPARAALTGLMEGLDGVRWTPPEQLHLTLRFIGPVDEPARERIESALARVAVRRFLLDLEGVRGFPPRGTPAILWAGVGRGHPLLHQLRQQVDDQLLTTTMAIALRPFEPHLTFARVREAAPVAVSHWLKRHHEFAGPTWPVDAFHLMASEPRPGGSAYRVLRSYALG